MADSTSAAPEEQMTTDVEETTEQKMERAHALFMEGKRALAAGNLVTANEKLSETCSLFTQLYDSFAVECFEPHMLYGKALLELSRLEPGVFNNALEGVPEEDESVNEEGETEKTAGDDKKTEAEADQNDDQFGNADELTEDQREEIQEQVEEALAENAEALDKGELPPEDPAQAEDGDAAKETEEMSAEDGEDANDEDAQEGAAGEDEGAAPETDATDDTANNVPNLQLAWEVLDVARAVCDKQEKTDDWQQKKAEVLLLLGDVSIEDENYKQAIDDLAVCLDIQQKIFSSVDRRIAETLFQMARAFNLSFEFAKAAEFYKKAFDVIKMRAESHEAKLAAGVECPDEKASLEKELSDLQALLPDIQMKVDDSMESAKNAEIMKEQQGESSAAPAFEDKETAASKPAAIDISNLVRKPVKRSMEPEEGDAAVKRCKGDEEGEGEVTTTNGNGHSVEANGDNGHAATADA